MSLREELQVAHEAGRLLDAIYTNVRIASDAEVVASELVVLHNEGSIDVVAAFRALEPSDEGPDFFTTRRVLEKALPHLDAPVQRNPKDEGPRRVGEPAHVFDTLKVDHLRVFR